MKMCRMFVTESGMVIRQTTGLGLFFRQVATALYVAVGLVLIIVPVLLSLGISYLLNCLQKGKTK